MVWAGCLLAYLLHDVSQLLLNLLLGALEALPQLIADAAALQQDLEGLLRVADLDDAVDVFGGAAQERGFEDAVGRLGVLLVQQRQVDVALEMRREPRLERGCGGGLSLAVQRREDGQRADQDEQVRHGDQQHEPVDGVEGPHFGRRPRWCRRGSIARVFVCSWVCACARAWATTAGVLWVQGKRSDCKKRVVVIARPLLCCPANDARCSFTKRASGGTSLSVVSVSGLSPGNDD